MCDGPGIHEKEEEERSRCCESGAGGTRSRKQGLLGVWIVRSDSFSTEKMAYWCKSLYNGRSWARYVICQTEAAQKG